MAAILEVRRISRSFQGLRVLRGVSFSVEAGAIVGLIGPNGAGKSTPFNIVSGFLRPDRAGHLRRHGHQRVGTSPQYAGWYALSDPAGVPASPYART
jgi:ABC-type branched-subunit amino acid transport system ATPase component